MKKDMANENGVNVQEKANDVELIELSDDGKNLLDICFCCLCMILI